MGNTFPTSQMDIFVLCHYDNQVFRCMFTLCYHNYAGMQLYLVIQLLGCSYILLFNEDKNNDNSLSVVLWSMALYYHYEYNGNICYKSDGTRCMIISKLQIF